MGRMHIYCKVTCFFILFMVCLLAVSETEILLCWVIEWRDDGERIIFGQFFDVLLTVHLSIILAINQLNAQNLLL